MKNGSARLFRNLILLMTLGLFLAVNPLPAGAADDQETIALNFLKFLGSDKAILSSEPLEGNRLDPALPSVTVARLFRLQGGGYLLISEDRSISPVKAYSLIGDFEALPPRYREALLAELELRVRAALAGTARTPLGTGMTETEKRWDFLLNLDVARIPLAYTPGAYLLQTKWNQGYPYNKFLPAVGGQTVVAGCVNVAVGQVMRYHQSPASGKGVVSYEWTPDPPPSPQPPWDPQTLKTVLYRPLNWERMPAAVDATTPEYQADEVALLMRDLGIANRTAFNADGSSTYLRTEVLTENYGYSTSIASMDNSSYDPFLQKIQTEMIAERPLLITFPGHMAVADGYVPDGTGTKVHVNLGWGGSADDFYFLDQNVTAGGYIFPTDAGNLTIHYNLKPCGSTAGDCYINLETGDGINELAITGNFNQVKDTDIYPVYLKGATTLSATRGYTNVAFSISIFNAADGKEAFVLPVDAQSSTTFNVGSQPEGLPEGKYLVRVSLCNTDGTSCYNPAAGFEDYTVTLTSGALTAAEKAVIDIGLDKPPVIGNAFPDLLLNTNSGTRRILIDARDENGDPVLLSIKNSNPAAVGAVLNGNILELTPTGVAKVSSRIVVAASANGRTAEKGFTVMTDDVETAFGRTFTVGGTFATREEVKTHRAILDGVCTIKGSRPGFSNQAFFSSVIDGAGGEVASADGYYSSEIVTPALSRGIYSLQASLCSGGSCYDFVAAGTTYPYALAVSCPDADATTATIAGLLGISLSVPGDVNGDGVVTLADAVLIMQMASGIDMTGKTVLLAADVDGDGRIGFAELVYILQAVANLRIP